MTQRQYRLHIYVTSHYHVKMAARVPISLLSCNIRHHSYRCPSVYLFVCNLDVSGSYRLNKVHLDSESNRFGQINNQLVK